MFRVGEPVDPAIFEKLTFLLETKSLPINEWRLNSGEGRSQCFGIVHQRNGTYAGSRMNYVRLDILAALKEIEKLIPGTYHAIQVNENYQSKPHRDNGNAGESCIIGFGDYTEGDLNIEGNKVSIRHRMVFFDGSKYTHSTEPWTGNRYSLVFHNPACQFAAVPDYSVEGNLLKEVISGVTRTYNSKGTLTYSSDDYYPERKARQPIMRACIKSI